MPGGLHSVRQLVDRNADRLLLAGDLRRLLQLHQLRLILEPQIVDLQELLLFLRWRQHRILMLLPVDLLWQLPSRLAVAVRLPIILVRVRRVVTQYRRSFLRAQSLVLEVCHLGLLLLRDLREVVAEDLLEEFFLPLVLDVGSLHLFELHLLLIVLMNQTVLVGLAAVDIHFVALQFRLGPDLLFLFFQLQIVLLVLLDLILIRLVTELE